MNKMAVSEQAATIGVGAPPARREIIYRHSVLVRVTHWVNVLCLTLLLMSGLKLFNVHPALYWGNYGYPGVPTVLAIDGMLDPETRQPVGITRIGDRNFVTTGILGATYDSDGRPRRGACPLSATLGARRGRQTLQCAEKAHSPRGDFRGSAGKGAHRAAHVAGGHRCVPVPVRPVRRASMGAHHPFHHRQSAGDLRDGPYHRGD